MCGWMSAALQQQRGAFNKLADWLAAARPMGTAAGGSARCLLLHYLEMAEPLRWC